MVTLPPEFTATKYPGYFWNVKTQTLYSLKVGGVLREMKITHPNFFNKYFHGYRVCHKGYRRNLSIDYLEKLEIKDSRIPIKEVY